MRGKLIFCEASLALIVSGVIIRLMPFRVVSRLAGRLEPASSSGSSAFHARAIGVGRALAQTATRLPWHSSCLVRAIAGRLMLARRRIPSTLRLGVATVKGQIQAHAWLTAEGIVICGAAEMEGFTPIAEFVGGPAL